MSDRKKVYTKVQKSLQQKLKDVPFRLASTLSMIVTGIVFARKVHFSSMSAEIPLEIQNTSIEKKIYRFFKNPKVDPKKIYE